MKHVKTVILAILAVLVAIVLVVKFTGQTNLPNNEQKHEEVPNFLDPKLSHELPQTLTSTNVSETVIGHDSRTIINNTKAFPYRTIVYIRAYFPGLAYGMFLQGTGTLIGAETVLTAGHVVYDAKYGGYANRIVVIPGYNRKAAPYGTANGNHIYLVPGYTANPTYAADMAAIKLSTGIGTKTGWLATSPTSQVGSHVTLSGYSGDLNGALGSMSGSVANLENGVATYAIDTTPGASGSGLYNEHNQIEIVHNFGNSGYNGDSIITPERNNLISYWKTTSSNVKYINRQVYVTAKSTVRYANLNFKRLSMISANTVYAARQTTMAYNGQTYYSVYNSKNVFMGFANRSACKTVNASKIYRMMRIRVRNDKRYSNLFLDSVNGTIGSYYNRNVYVTRKFTNGNGRAFDAVYTSRTGSFLGYIKSTDLV